MNNKEKLDEMKQICINLSMEDSAGKIFELAKELYNSDVENERT